jgi:hypothetical protein
VVGRGAYSVSKAAFARTASRLGRDLAESMLCRPLVLTGINALSIATGELVISGSLSKGPVDGIGLRVIALSDG